MDPATERCSMGRWRLSCSPDSWCSVGCWLLCLQEVLDFQVDKQARLNQLPATVSLRRHQLALGESTAWPGDAASAAGAAAAAGLNALGVVGSGRNGAVSGATQEELAEALVFSSHALERLKLRMEVRVCAPKG